MLTQDWPGYDRLYYPAYINGKGTTGLIFGKVVVRVYACILSIHPGNFMVARPITKRLFLLLACLAMLSPAMQVAARECGSMPVPYSASYSVTRNGDPDGSMQVLLERTGGNTFSYSMETRVRWGIFTARIEQRSDFSWQNGQILPGSYRATQRASIYKRSETVNFEIDLVSGMQDKLTVYLALARAFCEGEDAIGIEVVSGPRVKLHEYIVQTHEQLDSVSGELPLLHVRRGGPDDEKQTDLWLGEKNRFLPVKMIYRDKDIITDMQLIGISFESGS